MNCPKCDTEIPDGAISCPNCGFHIKSNKNKKLFLCASIVCAGIAAIAAWYCHKDIEERNTFIIQPIESVIELGTEIELEDLISYDKSNIILFSIVDDDGFDTFKLGHYTVKCEVENVRNNTKQISFAFEVKDTTKPKLTIINQNLHYNVGSDFNIESKIIANDISGECDILYDGEVNKNEAGTYTIDVYAKDSSGNISDKKKMNIIYERHCDVRNVCFGDTLETVKKYEEEDLEQDGDALGGLTTIGSCEYMLFYRFNTRNELYQVMLNHNQWHSNGDYYIAEYEIIIKELLKKYGSASSSDEIRYPLADYCSSDGEALMLGLLIKKAKWNLNNMDITAALFGDAGEITLVISYESTKISQPTTQSYF